MLTSTVALLALLTPAFASPINRRDSSFADPALAGHLRRRAPASSDTTFNSSTVGQAKVVPLNPKRVLPTTGTYASSKTSTSAASATSTKASTSTWSEVTSWSEISTTTTTKASATTTKASSTWVSVTPSATSTGYTSPFNLAWSASGWSFFDSWDFFQWTDPTHGAVTYNDLGTSWDLGLLSVTENTASLRTDNWTTLASGANRNSVRITSKQKVTSGSLVVFDVAKAPFGKSVWPAMWSVGDNWPAGGEIDIFEGVNNVANNQMTLHTSPGCTLSKPMNATGTILATECDATLNYNEGCGVKDTSSRSYGAGLNKAGGGVYVMYQDDSGIAIWFFLHDNIPDDITAGTPAFRNWGLPRARWDASSCDMDKFFAAQTLVINITICGDWAGSSSAWSAAGYSGSCIDAVMDPNNFDDAVFEFNSVKVYSPK